MKAENRIYSAPEFQALAIDETSMIMTSVTGDSSTENLTEEDFQWE